MNERDAIGPATIAPLARREVRGMPEQLVITSPVPPSLTFRFVAETRGLARVEELRLKGNPP
jgi:hypothetical protein